MNNDMDQLNAQMQMMQVQMQNQMIWQNDMHQRSVLEMEEQRRIMEQQNMAKKKRKR